MSFRPLPGECYRNAFLWAEEHPGWDIVHGIVWNPAIQAEMGHAWNEKDDFVYDPSADMMVPREVYYALGRISYAKRYTMIEAAIQAVKERSYGAWDTKVMASRHAKRAKRIKRSKKNPSALREALKIRSLREIYDLGWEFYYSQYYLSPTKDTKESFAIDLSMPRNVTILFAYEKPLSGHAEVRLHEKTNKHGEFISMLIGAPPESGANGFHALHAIYDHEFVHLVQQLLQYGSGRKRKDSDYPNTRNEHKAHLQQILYYLQNTVMAVYEAPDNALDGKVFSRFLDHLKDVLDEWKMDATMRRMLLKDVYAAARSLHPKTKARQRKLRKAGFPV